MDLHLAQTESPEKKKSAVPRVRKRQNRPRGSITKDVNAPKQPLTGYVRFLNENRDRMRVKHPGLAFSDITKLLAQEWSALDAAEKQKYLDEYDREKEKYIDELDKYKRTDAYKVFTKKQKQLQQQLAKKIKNEDSAKKPNSNHHTPSLSNAHDGKDDNVTGFDIPIFTEEFLEHNRQREAELRQLRKSNTEYEEQNAILSKHIENMKGAVDKLDVEIVQQRTNNDALKRHLEQMRSTLVLNFGQIRIPGSSDVPSLANIDKFIERVFFLISTRPAAVPRQELDVLAAKVKLVISKLECPP